MTDLSEPSMIEVASIIDSFNTVEITNLIKNQINNIISESDNMISSIPDHFQYLYYNCEKLKEIKDRTNGGDDNDLIVSGENKFYEICESCINAIAANFNLSINQEWISTHYGELPISTLSLYTMFVLELATTIYNVLKNYIKTNKDVLFKAFESCKNKKDASTLSNKKTMAPELYVIISNIYDITRWILDQMDGEEFLQYCNSNYYPALVIKSLFAHEAISGDFMSVIKDIYKNGISLNSHINFLLIANLKSGEIVL